MKTMKTHLLVATLLLVVYGKCYAQNYFSEAQQISKVLIKVKAERLDRQSLFNAVKQPKRNLQPGTVPQDGFQNNGRTPAPGVIGQPGTAPASPEVIDDTALMNEIDLILSLVNDDCTVPLNFPKKFIYLDKLLNSVQGIGNAGTGPTNFAFSEAAIIYGITDFVIKRAKEELLEVYLNDWYYKLNNDAIVKPLLPQTLSVYKAFSEDHALNFAKYGDKWKNAFQEDLRNIPLQLQDERYVSLVLSKLQANDEVKKQLTPLIAGSDELVYNLYLKKHLVNVVSTLSSKYLDDGDSVDVAIFKRCVLFADILGNTCGHLDDNNNYKPVKLDEIKTMDTGSWKIFLKLLYFRNKQAIGLITGSHPEKYCALLLNDVKIKQFQSVIGNAVTILTSYQLLLSGANANDQKTQELSFDDARKVFELSFQLLDVTSEFLDLVNLQNVTNIYDTNVRPYFVSMSEIGEGVSTRQYGKVLDGTLAILRKSAIISTGSSEIIDSATLKNLQRYGSFMVNVLTAKDAEGVETALDELVPKGQYQLKNANSFTVSLSAFPGLFVGAESIKKYQTDASGAINYNIKKKAITAFSLAPYLPVGIDFSFGSKTTLRKGILTSSSTNIFFQLLDLGAVLNYRISSDSSVNNNPDISFKQVLSPGIAVMRHLPNSPIVYGAGINYTPDLRKIKQGEIEYKQNAIRFGVFVGVDVTGLIFYTRKR